MVKNDNWVKRPLHKIVFDVVSKNKSLYLNELMDELRKKRVDVSEDEVRTALVKLEIWGYVDVFTDNKGTYITLRG